MKHGSERDQERARTADVLKERNALGVDRRSISDTPTRPEVSLGGTERLLPHPNSRLEFGE